MAKDKEKALAAARKYAGVGRDNLGRLTTVGAPTWNIGGSIVLTLSPKGFNVWFAKPDGEEGEWFASFEHRPQGWSWLENNALIFQLPTGGRIESPHGADFESEIISGTRVREKRPLE